VTGKTRTAVSKYRADMLELCNQAYESLKDRYSNLHDLNKALFNEYERLYRERYNTLLFEYKDSSAAFDRRFQFINSLNTVVRHNGTFDDVYKYIMMSKKINPWEDALVVNYDSDLIKGFLRCTKIFAGCFSAMRVFAEIHGHCVKDIPSGFMEVVRDHYTEEFKHAVTVAFGFDKISLTKMLYNADSMRERILEMRRLPYIYGEKKYVEFFEMHVINYPKLREIVKWFVENDDWPAQVSYTNPLTNEVVHL
jgi:hypothetical protein